MSEKESAKAMNTQQKRQTSSLMDRLEHVYSQYQQRHLYDRLNEIASRMEDTLLQVAIARELFNTDLAVSTDAQNKVEEMRKALEETTNSGQIAKSPVTEGRLNEVEQAVDEEADRIEARIHELRTEQASTVTAMQKLNDELNLEGDTRLESLSTLLADWEWEVHLGEANSFESKREVAREFARDMRQVLEAAREEIGAGFEGEEIEELADTLLAGEPLTLDALDESERDALAESKLGEYLTVTLG